MKNAILVAAALALPTFAQAAPPGGDPEQGPGSNTMSVKLAGAVSSSVLCSFEDGKKVCTINADRKVERTTSGEVHRLNILVADGRVKALASERAGIAAALQEMPYTLKITDPTGHLKLDTFRELRNPADKNQADKTLLLSLIASVAVVPVFYEKSATDTK